MEGTALATSKAATSVELMNIEMAQYKAQAMSMPGAAAQLIGQPLDGAGFGNDLKAQMEASAASAQVRSREMASYAASAMQGEAAAARLAGNIHAGSDFTAQLKAKMEGVAESAKQVHEGISGWSLASVVAIAKIQILYSLMNQVMSTIGSAPGIAIDAIENYKTSIITNAALITSQSQGVKDIGAEYQKNKVYTEAVEKVLVKMDTETAASYQQLQLMNRAYMLQGVYLDINNKKAVEGRRDTANALAVIAAASPNPNQQYTQEAGALLRGETRPGNMLLAMAVGLDKDIVEKIKRWKEAGTVDENLGKLFKGFAAAQGDIDSLWATVKSTMATIRDDVLRGGLAPAFAGIVVKLKEMSDYAVANKEKMQAFLREGFADAKVAAGYLSTIASAIAPFGQEIWWGAVVLGFASIAKAILSMNIALLATPVGQVSL